MPTKVKGFFKGFKKISQIFEEEKEPEIQIGLPTDVKHVAHIGSDGPVQAPSWMKQFKSAPLAPMEEQPQQDPEVVWVSEDTKINVKENQPDVPKPNRRRGDGEAQSRKSRQGRRHGQSRQDKDSSTSMEEPGSSMSDIPRRRKKKFKDDSTDNGGGSSQSKTTSSTSIESCSHPRLLHGHGDVNKPKQATAIPGINESEIPANQ